MSQQYISKNIASMKYDIYVLYESFSAEREENFWLKDLQVWGNTPEESLDCGDNIY